MQWLTSFKNMQEPADVAVVIPTVLRPSLARAVRSVFGQDINGRIQILIGLDKPLGSPDILSGLAGECPPNVSLGLFDSGYSTSRRHGGLYANRYSGALRTILSYTANSKYVAYLDDDDWWGRAHLSGLVAAVSGKQWAFSLRWLVDPETGWPICPDEWDSLGPGRGINQERFGGFVCPSSLLLDKEACHFVLPYWSLSPFDDGTGEDRLVFKALQSFSHGASQRHSCYYELTRQAQAHQHHAREFAARKLSWINQPGQIQEIVQLRGEAKEALARGEALQAGLACRKALALNPYHAPSLRCLALAETLAGRPIEARECAARALAIDDRLDREEYDI